MGEISGFTFVHNAFDSGYPLIAAIDAVLTAVDEVVVVDMASTDATGERVERHYHGKTNKVRIIPGEWTPGAAGACLRKAHRLYRECLGNVIIHFEADEVFSDTLIAAVWKLINVQRRNNLAVYRIQVEQNFQRVRWYPEPVHRVWPKYLDAVKDGHTTTMHMSDDGQTTQHKKPVEVLGVGDGFMWDVTNCFRDQVITRFNKQAELWGHSPRYRFASYHGYMSDVELTLPETLEYLKLPHWTWGHSPFAMPHCLRNMVGNTQCPQ